MLLLPSQQPQQDHFSNSLLSLLATLCRLPWLRGTVLVFVGPNTLPAWGKAARNLILPGKVQNATCMVRQ